MRWGARIALVWICIGLPAVALSADGVYHLIASEKHGAQGQDYEQWSALQRQNLAQQPGYVREGHQWQVAPGEGSITTLHWRFDPSCPECVQQARSFQGRHTVPQQLPAGGTVSIPVSIRASISHWPAGQPIGFAGGIEFSWWTSVDRVDWRFVGQKGFYNDEQSGLLDARWETVVPAGARWLILDTSYSNGILGGLGMRYLYELDAAPPAAAAVPPPASTPPSPKPPPPPERVVLLFGEVTGVAGEALPWVRLTITPSFAGAQTVAADASGFFIWRAPLPAETTEFTLAAVVELAAERGNETLFELREHASGRLVQAGSVIRKQLAPADAARTEIPIARQFQFAHLAQGWFSADAEGRPDPYLEHTPAARAAGYSDVYRQLWAAWYTAEAHFSAQEALRPHLLRAWVDAAVERSHFNGSDGQPDILLRPESSGYDDGARFTVLHEFGHFFDWASNGQLHRCSDTLTGAHGHVAHLGYFNPSTADSFVEGMATWYVGEVQRHGPWPRAQGADLIAEHGSLLDPRRAYDYAATSEEMAIAGVLHQLSRDDRALAVWAALRPDRPNLQAYHAALRAAPPAGYDGAAVDALFIAHGLYRQPYGNGQYDVWEPFVDSGTANGEYDPGERYGDLRYADMERTTLLRALAPGESLHPGQSSDAAWTRDATRERHSTQVDRSLWLALEGELPAAAYVRREPREGSASAYVVALREGQVPLALPPGNADGRLSVAVPGGRTIWSEDYATLRARLRTPAGRLGPLARVRVTAADLPTVGVLPIAVDGDPTRSPVRVIGAIQDARVDWPAELPAPSALPVAAPEAGQAPLPAAVDEAPVAGWVQALAALLAVVVLTAWIRRGRH